MSNETKNKTAAETVAENVAAVAEAVASNKASAEEVAQAAATVGTAQTKPATKGKKQPAAEPEAKTNAGRAKAKEPADALHEVGKAACKRHGLPAVWVTADGQCFVQENDARHHGKSLGHSAEPLKVEA